MAVERPTKTLIAVFTLVTALFLAVNNVVDSEPVGDWLPAIIFFVISAAFWIWVWQEGQAVSRELVVAEETGLPQAQEWIISKDMVPTTERPLPSGEETAVAEAPAEEEAEPDDLTRIEGIGPKYREALTDAGITTFEQIAEASAEDLEAVIKDAGMRRPGSLDTWPEQAAYAARGDWEGLDELQLTLKGGRRG